MNTDHIAQQESQGDTSPRRMEKTVIYLTRHGWREDWDNAEWKKTTSLPYDPSLSNLGLKQAMELGIALSSAGVKRIYCSPYYRCVQTANEVANASATLSNPIPICLENGLSEKFSEVEAKKHVAGIPDRRSREELFPDCPHLDADYSSLVEKYAWVYETKEMVLERGKKVSAVLGEIATRERGTFLIVTHASVLISLVRAFLDDDKLDIRSAVCSITKLVYDEEKLIWKMKIKGDCSHLAEGEQRPYSFSDEK